MTDQPKRRRIIAPDWDLRGWGEIAKAAYMGESTARRAAQRTDDNPDPLPVTKFKNVVRARRADIDAWRARHTEEVG